MLIFFVAGQIIAVAVVIIDLVSGTLTSANTVIQDPSKGKDHVKLIMLIIINAVIVNVLLRGKLEVFKKQKR